MMPWYRRFLLRVWPSHGYLVIVTPWVAIEVADMWPAVARRELWSGVHVEWGMNRTPQPGEMLYKHARDWTMRRVEIPRKECRPIQELREAYL